MKRAMFLRYVVLILISIVVCGAVATAILSANAKTEQQDKMLTVLSVMSREYSLKAADEATDMDKLSKELSKTVQGARITIIAKDGTVLGDSRAQAKTMENHADRTEVKEALETGRGIAIRRSDTLGKDQMYAAYKTAEGDILRMAIDTGGVKDFFLQILPATLIAMLVALLISMLVASNLGDSIMLPLQKVKSALMEIREGRYNAELEECSYEEVNDIIYVLNSLTGSIKTTISQLDNERSKVDFILESMEEGLVLVNSRLDIIHANQSAKSFFGCDFVVQGKSILYLLHNPKVIDSIEQAIDGRRSSLFDIESEAKRIISIHITPVTGAFLGTGGSACGAIMVVTDVTNERNAQRMRQEFFSNASHELKTPITSISGFAEIMQAGLAQDPEQEQEYMGRIVQEAKRMSILIDDILRISRLESGIDTEESAKYTSVDIVQVCREICDNLLPQAAKNGITIDLDAETCHYTADRQQMYELCQNLIDNAVKYNKQGGSVKVTLRQLPKGNGMKLIVSDTGIGIPIESHNRIFERFYRVDKGRSGKVGSTGLGLSIVKHIVAANKGEIALESHEGVGTTITVTLPTKTQ